MEAARSRLIHTDEWDLAKLDINLARTLAEDLEVVDNGFEGSQDLRTRLLLMKRTMQRSGHKPFAQFLKVQAKAATARRNLLEIIRLITDIFNDKSMDRMSLLLTKALSEVLLTERLLSKNNLRDELLERKRALQAKVTIIIIAGETNSGKSTFINVLLGQNVLPTDVLHCTYVVCKIVYSHSYIIETLDYNGRCEEYYCDDCEAAQSKLKELVTCDNLHRRQQSSYYKEITLKMPAEILKSGITLVDTPGIGENDAMDGVTIDFVREAQASAFIYIIKSDGAGGVQEDRLLAFLRAVKENYKDDQLEGTFDPQAAMFVCHRWDAINPTEAEKVKRNALMKLEMVWPGFQSNQTYLFSSTKTLLHLDIDPDFITDSYNDLLNGLKQLIDRATHNAIKYQYCWIKAFLQPACLHLRAMISLCTANKKELDERFRLVAGKQEVLMKTSHDHIPTFERKIANQKAFLKSKVRDILSLKDATLSDFQDYEVLLSTCAEDKFLLSSENRRRLDSQIVNLLIKHCDDYLLREGVLKNIEDCILQEIKEHIGLFEEQAKQIKIDMQGADTKRPGLASNATDSESTVPLDISKKSRISFDENDEYLEASIPDPVSLIDAVDTFLQGRKHGRKMKGILSGRPKPIQTILEKLKGGGNPYPEPKTYLKDQIRKLAAAICADEDMIDDFVSRYLQFSERYIQHAIKCIPRFISVNNELMHSIRQHREEFQIDKQFMKEVMEKLEPTRAQLQGYGFLYMKDVHADQINFNVDRRDSSVKLQKGLMASTRPNDDSGFVGSKSTRSRTREKGGHSLSNNMMFGVLQKCFWTHIQNARMNVNDSPISVTIKAYSIIPPDSEQYSEIAALRCLEHKNVAPFFGMTRIDGTNADEDDTKPIPVLPAFIFKGQLWAANVYRKMKLINIQEFVPTFLSELWQGLDFIHMEHLVHLELNLDTVMVDSQSGTVQLCQQCKPREAQLPANLSCTTRAAVCLSPSVLQGNVYQIADDIYAYGLLLWELLYPENLPYEEERNWTLERFIDEVHPSKMLKPALESLDASPAVKTILNGCLICTKGTIITMQDISRFREAIDNDPKLKSMKPHRSKPLEKKSYSYDSDEGSAATSRAPSQNSEPDTVSNDGMLQNRFASISEENPSKSAATRFVKQEHPMKRHSVTSAPYNNEWKTDTIGRRFSLPNKTYTSTKYVYLPGGGGLRGKEKSQKKLEFKNRKDTQGQRRFSTSIVPSVIIDPPDTQRANSYRSVSLGSSQQSQEDFPLSITNVENNFMPPFQLSGGVFTERQNVESNSLGKYNPPTKLSNENNSLASEPGNIHEPPTVYCEDDTTGESSGLSGNDFPIQSQSISHKISRTSLGRQSPLKQPERTEVLRVSPTFQGRGNTFSEHETRLNTDGNIKSLTEERISQSKEVRSPTFTSGYNNDFRDVSLSKQNKSEDEITDDTTQ